MVLITDGGSTKCDWVLLDSKGKLVFKTETEGLNPAIISEEELERRIQSNADLKDIFEKKMQLDFYGAGCGTPKPKQLLLEVLKRLFPLAQVSVYEDTLAAVRSVTNKKSIVCILGTGSNSCYFDGKNMQSCFESLGYSIMDDASGSYFGRQLIRDYFYNKMPTNIAEVFKNTFNLETDVIKQNAYKKQHPNKYLASFAKFIFTTNDENAYFYNLVQVGISKFIQNYILCHKNHKDVPIHFVGSIAYFSQDILKDCLKKHNLEVGVVIQKPINGLINYYKNNQI